MSTHRAWLALEYPGVEQFDNPTLEWRRLFSRALRHLLLVLAARARASSTRSHGAISRAAAVVAPGLMVMAVILFMGAVSGAHLNPAVTLSFSAARRLPLAAGPRLHRRAAARRDARLLFLKAVFGTSAHLGRHAPGHTSTTGRRC